MAMDPTPQTLSIPRKAAMLPAPVLGLVQTLIPDCHALLPSDMRPEQFRAALWLELTGRPDLHECTLQSLRECIVKAATYGLLPGRDCHFLPFRNRRGNNKLATYVPNYQGIILALERTGKVRRAFAHPVHRGDSWEYDYFSDRPLHRPAVTMGKDPGPELFYYGAIQFHDGTFAVEIVTLEDLEAIRRSSPAHEAGPWVDWPVMMKRKSAIKRVAKYVRLTPKVAAMLEEDEAREQQDIPAERHAKNIIDLFGDDPRGSTPTHSPEVAKVVSTPPPPSPQSQGEEKGILGHPERKSAPEGSAWRDTIETHLIDSDLLKGVIPPAMYQACMVAYHSQTFPDARGLDLAGQVLDLVTRAQAGEVADD